MKNPRLPRFTYARRLVSDTAGLREKTDDEIEREGMRRARGAVDNAHLAIFVVDGSDVRGAGDLLQQLREEAAAAEAEKGDREHWHGEGGEDGMFWKLNSLLFQGYQ